MSSDNVSPQRVRTTDPVTAAGQLSLVQYQPFQHVETRLLEALSQALPWSDALASAFREVLARAGPSNNPNPSTAAVGITGRVYEAGRVQREAKHGAQFLARGLGRHDHSGSGTDSGSHSESSSDDSHSESGRYRRGRRGSSGSDPALAAHAIQLALATMGAVPGHLKGAAEGRCSAAAFALSVAMASAAEGGLPPQLLRVVSPYRAGLEQLRPLGKGGFGSVVAVRSRLDHRLMALKTVAFRSQLPPWSPPEQLERQHAKLLREVQALAGLDGSPHVVRYYNAWIEPAWEKLGQQLQRGDGGQASATTGAAQASMQTLLAALAAAKAAPAPGPGRQVPRAAAAAAKPGTAAATASPHLAHLPRFARMNSDGSGTSGSHSCRIRILSRSNSSGGSSSCSGSEDNVSAGSSGEDHSRSRGRAARTPVRGRRQPRSPHRLARANTPQRPTPTSEPLVDLPISPDATIVPSVVATAAALLQPIVTLPPSSSEPTRRRSLDMTLGTASGSSTGAARPLVSLASTPDDEGPLPRGWPVPLPPGRRRRLQLRASQPLITSLSTSPEGPTGATPTHGSLLSSSVESIRVPPGARIAASSSGSRCSASPAGSGGHSPSGLAASSNGGGSGGAGKQHGQHHSTSPGQRAWRAPEQREEYSWTFDRSSGRGDGPTRTGERSAPGSSSGSSSSNSGSTVTSCSSGSSSRSATATATAGAAAQGAGADDEFSWTFDRGDGEADGNGDAGARVSSSARAVGCGGRGPGSSERRLRKGRRGRDSGEGGEGIFHFEGTASASERPARAARSGSSSGGGRNSTDSSGSDSDSYSSTGSSGSGSESSSGSESGSGSETGSDSSSESGNDSDPHRSYHRHGGRHRGHAGIHSRAGGIILPRQAPLPAPRHQRRRPPAQSPVVCSPTQGLQAETLQRRRRQQQQRRRRSDDSRDGGAVPPAFDLAVLSGIRRWPYTLYISMELAMGPTLTRWLQLRAQRLGGGGGSQAPEHPPDPAILERSLFRQLVTGLSHVHAAGIIHRDLKPANIFLVPVVSKPGASSGGGGWDGAATTVAEGSAAAECYLVKIGDFGLAKGHEDSSVILSEADPSSSLGPSSATSSVTSAGPDYHGPFGSTAAVAAAAAASRRGALPRPASLPLLTEAGLIDAAMTSDGGGTAAPPPLQRCRSSAGTLPRQDSGSTSAHTSGVGTASYSAPEQLQERAGGVSYYGPEVDIYPLGLILMELFCVHGTAMERANAMREARQGHLPPSFQRTYPGEAKLAEACLRTRPEQRPSAAQILAWLDILWGPQPGGPGPGAAPAGASMGGSVGAGAATAAALVSPRGADHGRGRRASGSGASSSDAEGPARGGAFGSVAARSRKGNSKQGLGHAGIGLAVARPLRAVNEALQRASSGPLPPPRHRSLAPPPLRPLMPLSPLPPSLSPPESASFVIGGAGRGYPAAVAAVLEDVGTQTDLTWVPADQPTPLPLPLGQAGRHGAAATALPPVPTAANAASPAGDAVSAEPSVGAMAATSTGNGAEDAEGGCGREEELVARLRLLEAEVLRLRRQLAGGDVLH